MTEVFLDTSYVIALASKKDHFHDKALALSERLQEEAIIMITTRAVLLEIGNAFSGSRFRRDAAMLLDSMEEDPDVGIVSLTDTLFHQGVKLYKERLDKGWGLIDCISFVVMWQRNIYEALTTDDHFRQAGFRVLL